MLIGLVGKPNVGKSTFFKALTLAEIAIAPYPFTTIEANQGVGFVKTSCPENEKFLKDKNIKCNPKHGYCIQGQRFVPVKLMDVAGLVPGAHKGKGRGNQFLDDLREADCLIHVLDTSGTTDPEGKPTSNYDITYDIKFLQDEIDLWLYDIIAKKWQTFIRKVQQENLKLTQELAKQLSSFKINEETIKQAMKAAGLAAGSKENPTLWNSDDIMNFVREIRKLNKPIIIAANKIDLPQSAENIEKLKQAFPEHLIIPCSAESELALREAARDKIIEYIAGNSDFKILDETKLNEKQKNGLQFIKTDILEKNSNTGIQQCLNAAVFDFLKFIVVYPVENENHWTDSKNNVLPDAILMPQGSTALDLAFAIHTDIGNSFVAAIDARTHKRVSRDYILKNSDIIRIMTQ